MKNSLRNSGVSKSKDKGFRAESVVWEKKICLDSFGVKIGLRSSVAEHLAEIETLLPEILPNGWRETSAAEVEHWFSVYKPKRASKKVSFYKNDELLATLSFDREKLDFFVSSLRLTIAEHAPEHVFLHSGAVGYKGRAIIIPGKSFTGKTTLVAELIKKGCQYYSDEYAVVNREGMIEPYPKKLSLRGILDAYRQVDVPAEEVGGELGTENIPVGLILLTEYKENAKFKPRAAGAGEGFIGLIANSVSIRRNPQFVLEVLTPVVNRARIIKTKRGAAERFAGRLLEFLEEKGESAEN